MNVYIHKTSILNTCVTDNKLILCSQQMCFSMSLHVHPHSPAENPTAPPAPALTSLVGLSLT